MKYIETSKGEEFNIEFTKEDVEILKKGISNLCCIFDSCDEVPFAWVRMTKIILDNDKDGWMSRSPKNYGIETVKFINRLLTSQGQEQIIFS